jgi:hypothetical protein
MFPESKESASWVAYALRDVNTPLAVAGHNSPKLANKVCIILLAVFRNPDEPV